MATYKSSAEFIAAVDAGELAATKEQVAIANAQGIELPPNASRAIAAAALRTALAAPLGLTVYDLSEAQDELLDQLGVSQQAARESSDLASAYIRDAYLAERLSHHAKRNYREGDVVRVSDQLFIISSIGADGRIHFRGGGGRGCWPDQVTEIVARGDNASPGASKARKAALSTAASRAPSKGFTVEECDALAPFAPSIDLAPQTVDALEATIDGANDEKPLQQFIERHPEVLAALLPGRPRFVLPRPRLGVDFVPDFLIADEDSRGARWIGIELETPRSGIVLKSKRDFDEHAREGLKQVREWREWLSENLHVARKASDQLGGYGLPGISGHLECWVVVGRRVLERPGGSALRRERWTREQIEIRTYDGLLERLRNLLSAPAGPPASNPYLLHRDKLSEDA